MISLHFSFTRLCIGVYVFTASSTVARTMFFLFNFLFRVENVRFLMRATECRQPNRSEECDDVSAQDQNSIYSGTCWNVLNSIFLFSGFVKAVFRSASGIGYAFLRGQNRKRDPNKAHIFDAAVCELLWNQQYRNDKDNQWNNCFVYVLPRARARVCISQHERSTFVFICLMNIQ